MGFARCLCNTKAKLAIKAEERATRLQNSVKLSLLCFLVIFFALAKSDIIACAIVILKPCGFSDILFAHKLAKRITLGVSRISLRSNITRRRRIELA